MMPDVMELAEAPKVTLAGKEYAIPRLALAQIKRVVPLALGWVWDPMAMTDSDFDKLYTIIYYGLTCALPDLTREQFDDMRVGFNDALNAYPVIAKQADLILGNRRPAPSAPDQSPSTSNS